MSGGRMRQEAQTIEAMIGLYCREVHKTAEPCDGCRHLLDYARLRLEKCPFQEGKTTCGKCPVHCYRPAMRSQVREVMRYAGPRMVRHHPLLALRHMIQSLRKKPVRRDRGARA
jgi:hypothetical protein